MLSLKTLALLLPALSAAYTLHACTDNSCSEGCKDFSAPDVSSDTDCLDFGFVAKSIYWTDTKNTLDGWKAAGCNGGPGSEDVWINDGNPENNACIDQENSDGAPDGFRYYIINNSAE
ncbi:hypothetical protein BGW36DRAFT_431426 [Talaromyces proteolyticus]|uniref:Uncharacterized protein n=1 Tax=Talaromyces proteolyticus TaxID=1131652 RepID=A0AAD4KI71_9EURO|nr:uncharacterized protein BGW36DRAFT_431426 [Talaromyces proteolyticus]KAH8692206.1 hypothetical protein BGW36DRAFT_431426 [Talaromyces proteolyticus]